MPILIDSGFLYALYNQAEVSHPLVRQFLSNYKDGLAIPIVILPEVGYLFRRDMGKTGVSRFLFKLSQFEAVLAPIDRADIIRAHEISVDYQDAKFDLVDCFIMAMAERLQITEIGTFDRRDFSIFRPRHCDYLTLLP